MKSLLFVFDSVQISPKLVAKRLYKMPSLANWYAFLENAICLASNDDAKQISAPTRVAFPDLSILVTEIDPKMKGGWLPRSVWTFLKNPQPVDTAANA